MSTISGGAPLGDLTIGGQSVESGGLTGTNGSTIRQGRLYGRKWQILIYKPAYKKNDAGQDVRDPENDVQMDVSRLRCVFKTKADINTMCQLGTLAVYNMNAKTEKEVIIEGFQIAIYAGYQEGQYGEIFTGDIIQIFRNRENGIDYRLEIVALKGNANFTANFCKTTVAAGSTPRDVPEILAKQSDKVFESGEKNEELPEQPLPRGKVLFGTPAKYLRALCTWNDAYCWEGKDGRLEVRTVEQEIPEENVLELTPTTGLVGTPVYTDNGINIKMLMEPRIGPWSMVKIDNEIIQRQAVNIDPNDKDGKVNKQQTYQKDQFDQDGEYQVFSIEHSGDTWGDDWTTSVVGVSRNGRDGLLTAVNNKNQQIR